MDNVDMDSAAYSNCYGSRRRYVQIVIYEVDSISTVGWDKSASLSA